MKIEDLKQFTRNKISMLELRLANALQAGDTELYAVTEIELEDTRKTLEQIEPLYRE